MFLGGDPSTGDTISLTESQARRLIVLHAGVSTLGQRIGTIVDDLNRD